MFTYHNYEIRNGQIILNGDINSRLKFNLVRESYNEIGISGKSVLDVGCASGLYSFFPRTLGASQVLGIDNENFTIGGSYVFLNKFLAFRSRVNRVKFRKYEFLDLVIESFDVVQLLGILHHLYYRSTKKNLTEIALKCSNLSKNYLLIEYVNTANYGPYQNEELLTKSKFLDTFENFFPKIIKMGLTTNYQSSRVNRELYLMAKK